MTDLDVTGESVNVRAFADADGGAEVAVTPNLLANPATIPSLALGNPHPTNDLYVVDATKVNLVDAGTYGNVMNGSGADSRATVLFVYADSQPVRRLDIAFTGNSSGVWIAGMQFNDVGPCFLTADGGFDAGVTDAGQPDSGQVVADAGVPDAGQPTVDAGTPDAGVDVQTPTGCGCASADAAQAIAALLLVGAVRRRRVRTPGSP